MAKKKVLRKKRVKAQKKPQPLPKSVQVLLRYLSGSDVKVSSSARQPAMVAQQFAPLPQQQQPQQQQQQPQQRRRKQTGQVVASSPLAQLAPAPAPPSNQPTPEQQKARLEAEAKAKVRVETKQKGREEATAKVAQLEQSLTSFKKQAGQVAVALSEDIRKSKKSSQHYQQQDYDPLDGEVDAPTSKPFVAEQGLLVNTALSGMFGEQKQPRASSVPTRASSVYEPEEIEIGQGAYAASQYIKAVASPEMTPKVTSRGRPKLTEQQKAANSEQKKLEKAQRKELIKSAGETLYQEGQSATAALQELTKTITVTKKVKKMSKAGSILVGVDPSTQVEFLASAGGAAAKPTQQRGQSVLEMLMKGGGGAAKK